MRKYTGVNVVVCSEKMKIENENEKRENDEDDE